MKLQKCPQEATRTNVFNRHILCTTPVHQDPNLLTAAGTAIGAKKLNLPPEVEFENFLRDNQRLVQRTVSRNYG